MYDVTSNRSQIMVGGTDFRTCMAWLTAKASEYEAGRVNWLSGPGLSLLTLSVGGQQWTLTDSREYFKWVVTVDGKSLGIFHYLEDAKQSVTMTWGDAVFTPLADTIDDPAERYTFACGQASGTLQRVRLSKAATKLPSE